MHDTDMTGQARFFSSTEAGIKNLKVIKITQAADPTWLAQAKVQPVRTWQWEAAAIDRLEAGEVEEACKLLLAGISLDASANSLPKNRRLVHLLAGLSTRYKAQAGYLDEIENMLPSREAGENWLSRGLEKWRDLNSAWHKRWTANDPVWWHHPMQTRTFKWQRTCKMRRPPPNPEIRQRPVKIA